MQTIIKPIQIAKRTVRQPAAAGAKRESGSFVSLVIVFGAYSYMVYLLQGFNFDTGFLAFYCAALTVFIGRALLRRQT